MKKIIKSVKGFSPVVAALILMLLAVAAGVIAYGYVMGWIGGATQTSGVQPGELQFDSIYADASENKIKMYVRNIGGKTLTIDKIYVNGVAYPNATEISGSLGIGEVAYLEVSVSLTAGYFYEVKVTCTDGTTVAQSVQAK